MAISKNITWRTLSVTGAVLRISVVRLVNDHTRKGVSIAYAVYASATAYGNGDEPIYRDELSLNSVDHGGVGEPFTLWKSKMEESGENIISASYVAVKQLADWTGASNSDLGDE